MHYGNSGSTVNQFIRIGGRSDATASTSYDYDYDWCERLLEEHSIAYNLRPRRHRRTLAEEVDAYIRESRRIAKEEHRERQRRLSWTPRDEPEPHPQEAPAPRRWRSAMMAWRVQVARVRKGSRQSIPPGERSQ